MASVVFVRAMNVGGANVCRPAEIAKRLAKFDVINIGAVGTFVVRAEVIEFDLRSAVQDELPFKCEIMICPARELKRLVSQDPFAGQPLQADVTRFVSIAGKKLRATPALSLSLPPEGEWLLKIIAIRGRFVVGLYRRQMKAISYLAKIEKQLGVPLTTRNWNTIMKIAKVL